MLDLFKTTFLGQAVRVLTNGKYMTLDEEKYAIHWRSRASMHNEQVVSGDSTTRNGPDQLVTWYIRTALSSSLMFLIISRRYSDDDPQNPQNWSATKKTLVATQIWYLLSTIKCRDEWLTRMLASTLSQCIVGHPFTSPVKSM